MPKVQRKNKFLSVIHTSFTKRISLFISLFIIILLVCFGVLSYILTNMNAASSFSQTMNSTGSLISGVLDDNINSFAGQLDIISENKDMKNFITEINVSGSADSVKDLNGFSGVASALDIVAGSDSSIIAAWVVSEQNGIFAGSTGEDVLTSKYVLDDQAWYSKYVSVTSERHLYICTAPGESRFVPGENVVNIIVPLESDGNIYAFCGIEVKADRIFRVLSEYSFSKGSYPIVSADGFAVYVPSGSEFSERFSLNDAPLTNIISQNTFLLESVGNYVSENGGMVYYYQKTSNVSGWNILVLFDSTEITGGAYKTFTQQMLILVCLCILLIIAVINLLHKESAPLHDIRSCTEEALRGNGNYRITTKVKNELGNVAENINQIAEKIQSQNNIISNYVYMDTLTGLENRSKLYERMEDIIQTREEGRSRFAVMFVDIDNFKWLNETLGHNFGDSVLCSFASIIKEQLPPEVSIFRFSGDEFILLKEFDTDYSEVHTVIEKLHGCFNKPLEIMNDKIYIKFSIGISIYPNDDLTPDLLLRDAEMALHRAKESGKDRVAFYTNASRKNSTLSKAAIARNLNEALGKGELFLHYQPIVAADNCDIHGFEVLLRWISPEFGVVPPTEFINVAEESGVIVQIGTWIFESACRTLKQINETLNPNVIMSINVSPVQLRRDDYLEHVKRVIDITHVNPKNIQLEITESTLIDFTDSKSKVINEINDMGIALALDDFGTGYSSLNYLKNFPIKCLKIDKSFIDEINKNQRDYAITDSIIDLVHSLGIHTVAEGIETVEQYKFLAEMKCDYIQGFLMSKPLEEADAIEFVERYDDLHKPDKRKLEENERQLADERKQRLKEKEASNKGNNGSAALTEDFIISK